MLMTGLLENTGDIYWERVLPMKYLQQDNT